ncbi:MAG: hypothetical protein V8R80_03805 [Eubacterium sp.]
MSEIIEYKCPCCGGAVNFDSSRQKMKCPYCDTEFDIEAITAYNEDTGKRTGGAARVGESCRRRMAGWRDGRNADLPL